MRKLGYILVLVMALASCENEVPEASVRIIAHGFTLQESFDSPVSPIPSFEHKVSGGYVKFINDREVIAFNLVDQCMGETLITIPEGDYILEVLSPAASLYGQATGSFKTDPVEVSITARTDTLHIDVRSYCSLILVSDESGQLEEGAHMIERHYYADGYFRSYPLSFDTVSGLYYAYFTPDTVDSNPSAFVWFYGKTPGSAEGGLPTTGFELGYQYHISVLE